MRAPTSRLAASAGAGPRALAGVALALLAAACGPGSGAPPRPTGVSPDRGAPTAPVAIRIRGTFGTEVSADFSGGGGDVVDARFQARLGTTPLDDVALRQDGGLDATVPAGLAPATYDLTVVDPSGRTGTLPQAFRVLAPGAPSVPVAAFRVHPVGAQVAYAPFTVTVTAVDAAGEVVADYAGEAQLSDGTGTVTPSSVGLFVDGRWTGAVEVRARHAADVLKVTDAGGAAGTATLAVAPAPAASVRFVTAAPAAQAGACTGPITLALRDAFGQTTAAAGALALSVAATPDGVTLHPDPGCSAALGTPTVAAGQETVSLWAVATAAGALGLAASGAGLAGDVQAGTVAAGPPSALAFVTPPREAAAGECSPAATLEVRDAWGNPSAAGVAALELQATPAAGFTFHADACVTSVTTLSVPAGATTASFRFRGSAPGTVRVVASAPGLAGAAQDETIVAATATRLVFTTAPQTVTAGICSGAVTVEARDAHGNPAALSPSAPTPLTLKPDGLAFFAGTGCTGGAPSFAAGATAATFSFRATAPGAVTVSASAGTLPAATQDETIAPGAAAHLDFATAPQTVTAGMCSGPATVESRDAADHPSPVSPGAATTVTLGGAGFTFYAGPGCTGAGVGAVTLPAGATSVTFSFRATVAGTSGITAGVFGLGSSTQPQTILAGATDHFTWSTIASPQAQGAAFAVTLTAADLHGNRTTYAGTVTLSASASSVACAAGCTSATETGSFTAGRWTGAVVVSGAATGIALVATGGGRTGVSGVFDVVGGAAPRSPPLARYTASARVITSGNAVTFDAGASTDGETPAAALSVSWHFEARDEDQASTAPAGTTPTWTGWTTTRTATHAFINNTGAPIVYRPRLAVRDTEAGPGGPDVGYASGVLVVLPDASDVCVVDTDSLADDNGGSSSCDVKGSDGRTSLTEAIRAAHALPAGSTMNVVFSGTRHVVSAGGTTFWLNAPVRILASPGAVTLDGVSFSIHAEGVHLAGLELTHLASPLLVDASGEALLEDLRVHDGQGIEVQGRARVLRAAMSACSGGACIRESGTSAWLAVFFSDLAGAGSGVGVSLEACQGTGPLPYGVSPYDPFVAGWSYSGSAAVVGTVLTGFEAGVSVGSGCAHPLASNDTFDGNGVGLALGGATTGYVGNNIYSHQTVAAVTPAACAVDLNVGALVHQNASDGCAGDAATLLTGDPLYVDPSARDFRIQYASPARDAAEAYSTELDDAGPGLYLGAAPDRGGRETY